jgi:alpha-amylase/alpha-mannosidase (GH57 family)
MTAPALKLVLCWHMHQPQYRHAVEDRYLKPWTWLHGIKDYADMAAHLESVPGAKAVVNFSSILLVQLEDYAARIARWRLEGLPIGDPLLDALGGGLPDSVSAQLAVTEACLHAHEAHMIGAFPAFAELHAAARAAIANGAPLDEAAFYDLVVWYHLAWTGESLRRDHPLLRDLLDKARAFTRDDGRQLLVLIGNVLRELIPRYRRLAESGAVELSMTPHGHPILPLLVDLGVAREAMPEVPLPGVRYPGGLERCRWHIARAVAEFERHFGHRPAGCWPSEGGVSEEILALLARSGFDWTATGTNVLRNSIGRVAETAHFSAWRFEAESPGDASALACFFRDDDLSDRIGFQYSSWAAEHAVDDFIARLEEVHRNWRGAGAPVVSMIMDGENAWEHYPYNAWYFLQQLYSALTRHEHIELTTFRDLLSTGPAVERLPRLVAGSWVYGNFSVWIGDPQKNRAWELLVAAKSAADRALSNPDLTAAAKAAIVEQLAVCEGSDWFWWLGRDNRPEDSVDFDNLFRAHLEALYWLLGESLPDHLEPIAALPAESATPGEGGAMRRAGR